MIMLGLICHFPRLRNLSNVSFYLYFLFFYMGIYIHEIDTSLLKLTLLMRRKINIHYKE